MRNYNVLKIAPAFLLLGTMLHAQQNDTVRKETEIEQVVLIGYGKQKKTDLTGSITALTTEDFNKGAVTTAEGLINGRSSGLVITQSGTPGSEATIRVRGGSSLVASNDPLLIVDGLPLDGVSLSTINPNDIESFSILKDAASTAIYGSRGSNGVILITTKKGSKRLRVSLNAFSTLNTLAKKVDVYTGDEFREIVRRNTTNPVFLNQLGLANTDWQKEIFKTSVTTDINASVSGSLFGKVPARLSIENMDNSGLLITSRFRRSTANFALSPSFLDDHLKFNLTGSYSYTFKNNANEDAIRNSLSMNPTSPVYDTNSAYGGYYEWINPTTNRPIGPSNPVSMLLNKHDVQNFKRFFGNVNMEYKFHFLPELRLIANAGLDSKELDGHVVTNPYSRIGYYSPNGTNGVYGYYGENSYSDESILNKNFNTQLNYIKNFGRFNLDVMGGYEYQNYHKVKSTSGNTLLYGIDVNQFYNPDTKPDVNLQAFFGRLNLGWDNKYLVTVNYRRDGSSRFSKDNRWGDFGGVAAAWKISEESFLKGNSTLSDLKLRASVGKIGNQDVGDQARIDYLKTYATSVDLFYQFGNDFIPISKPNGYNQNLKWEESIKYNIGLDFGFINNRIKGTLDFYLADTKDLLNIVAEGPLENLRVIGFKNFGEMQSKGIDLGVDVKAIQNEKFSLNFNYNVSYNNIDITKLPINQIDKGAVGLGGFVQTWTEGYSPFAYSVYQQLYDNNGKPVEGAFVDRNGDGQITTADKYIYKKPQADVTMGLMTNAAYKNWDFSMGWRASVGNYVYDRISADRANLNSVINTVDNTITNAPVDFNNTLFVEASKMSDYYVKNGSFIKLDNVTLGYTFKNFLGNSASFRVYGAAQNVLIVTKYKNLDPEVFDNGMDNSIYPRARMFTLGINANF
ncbi:SusC/RagA family TonB-linked outer membrane protein [Epilithonimonas mollis]|uniref:Iron complex outermembrane recepter protein n=1 Tax=Epilithonimonas mollis TaxID=216903 RepID=A0A1M6P317_9FLAO|nr:SusC/RagA family TonB-linked outer membrane protein [Epilithonimonas mollis]SHK02314.1 iron complex outermembrane recepter protein [Epilithonimonas mollis]